MARKTANTRSNRVGNLSLSAACALPKARNIRWISPIRRAPTGPSFRLCFNDTQNVICALAGQKDQMTTTSGRFVANTANGYNGAISAWLLVTFGGGSSSQVIEINSITVTRLESVARYYGRYF